MIMKSAIYLMPNKIIAKMLFLILLLPIWACAHPFEYDLHLQIIPGNQSKTMICFHGMGGNYRIGDYIKEITELDHPLVSFNFPDHDIREGYDAEKTTFGTIHELLPALYVLKTCIIDEKREDIVLYGFSAGGGAIVNLLAVLNGDLYALELQEIGIDQKSKKLMLEVLQKGLIILDTPLKSLREIIAFRGIDHDLKVVGSRYHQNNMEDDAIYVERLKKVNSGKIEVIIGTEAGHSFPHPSLWEYYLSQFPSS
jgi:hypothetical protein